MSGQQTRNFTRLAIAIVVAAMVIGAGMTASAYFRTKTTVTVTSTEVSSFTSTAISTTTATTSTGPSLCGENVYNIQTELGMENVPVLLMQPGTTAYVCVTYQSLWKGNSSQFNSQYFENDTYEFGFPISEQCEVSSGTASCNGGISHSFVISASPSSIQPSPTTNYVAVVYTVSALSNSTGFYERSAPYDYCIGMPMAVGYSASQVNSSDFAPILQPPCALLPFSPIGVSVGGMNVMYIAFGS